MANSEFVTLRGGVPVLVSVMVKLLDLETRGARFHLADNGRFRVDPPTVLTERDRQFLREHQADTRRAIEYSEQMVPQ